MVVRSVKILDVKDMNSCTEERWKNPNDAKSNADFKICAACSPL